MENNMVKKYGISELLIGILCLFAVWEITAFVLNQSSLIPHIWDVWAKLYEKSEQLLSNLGSTLFNTLIVFIISFIISFIMAVITEEYKIIDKMIGLPLVALQNIPKVAIIPAIYILSKCDLIQTKILCGVLITFFPIYENIKKGLYLDSTGIRVAYGNLGKHRLLKIIKIKLPEAASNIFIGMKVGITFALIGVLVAEMTIVDKGLGSVIMENYMLSQNEMVFAAILVASILGMLLYSVISIIEKHKTFAKYTDNNYKNYL